MLGARKLKNAVYAFNAIRDASSRYDLGFSVVARRFLHLYRKRRFSPFEMHFYDLLNPRITDEALGFYMSREEMFAFDERYLLGAYLCLTSDKTVFYSLCMAAGIPIPRLLAVFDLPEGWAPDGRMLSSPAEWCAFMQTLPQDFVIKPALGLLGKGVNAFRREANEFVDHHGCRRSDEALYDYLCGGRELNLFTGGYAHHSLKLPQGSHKTIIQERLSAHPELAELTGSQALCTCRLFTRADRIGNVQLLGTVLRVVSGNSLIDNFEKGATGNLWCSVDPESGRILDAFSKPAGSDRLELLRQHPVTGRDVVGFHIPHWGEATKLALRMASIFRPQPLISWDIGITRDGPVAVEGNVGGHLLPSPMNQPVRTLTLDQ